jgi:hypothetical protein
VDFSRSRTFKSENGLLKDSNTNNTYTLISEDAILSKEITLFKRNIQIVGRTCSVDNSINSSSAISGSYLIENFRFTFVGELTLKETCLINGTNTSQDWTFKQEANISLPLTCGIESKLINCGAIKIHSDKTRTFTLKDHRMKIWKRQHIEEEKATLTEEDFETQPVTAMDLTIQNVWTHPLGGVSVYQWTIIIITIAIILAIGLWCYCKKPNPPQTPVQEAKSNSIEMKAYFGPGTPTHLHPEAQHPHPEALKKSKTYWEKLADKQMREDPFQMITAGSAAHRKSMREQKEAMRT